MQHRSCCCCCSVAKLCPTLWKLRGLQHASFLCPPLSPGICSNSCSLSSVLFSHSVLSDSLRAHGLQHARLPHPSPTPWVAQTHVHWVSDAIQPSHPLPSLLLLPSIFPRSRVFSNKSVLRIRWPKYWSFSFSNSPLGLISLRINWFDVLTLQGTLKSLL